MKSWRLTQINQWVYQTSLKALEEAYQGALVIKEIEMQHFGGGAIMVQPDMGKTVIDYFRTQLDRQLLRIRSNLLRFRITGFLVNRQILSQFTPGAERPEAGLETPQEVNFRLEATASEAAILEKLAFIESVVGRYRSFNDVFGEFFPNADAVQTVRPEVLPDDQNELAKTNTESSEGAGQVTIEPALPSKTAQAKEKIIKPKQPESMVLFGGADRIAKEFNPKYEQEVVQELRIRRVQNRMAVRWLAMLLLVPLLVQVLTKNVILDPILGNYFERNPSKVELSNEIEEEFLHKFSEYKEALEVKHLLAKAVVEEEQREHRQYKNSPAEEKALAKAVFGDLPAELLKDTLNDQPGKFRSLLITSGWTEVEEELQERALEEKALELWREARQEQLNGLKNVLADGAGLVSFVVLVYVGRQRLTVVRNFSNRAFLSLNDPTKVFLFILVTDMFVGFHSAEGWEVILEGFAHHFGLPESKVFINSFIATIPVIIDACVKFWIFTYLTRYSASASAIYERMNT